MARYDRFFRFGSEAEVPEVLLPGGALRFLVDDFVGERPGLDIHLRERKPGGALMYYHGTTCLLTVEFETPTGVRCKASDSYGAPTSPFQAEYGALMLSWDADERDQLRQALRRYVRAALEGIDETQRWKRFYANEKEGYWQNRLATQNYLRHESFGKLLIVDREAVLGFADGGKKRCFYEKLRQSRERPIRYLQSTDSRRWGSRTVKLGDEADLLALGEGGTLYTLELKYGDYRLYWAPLQAAVYRDAFRDANQEVAGGIIAMVEQKVQLGLLPEEALALLPRQGAFREVKGMVILAEPPSSRSGLWEKLQVVRESNADLEIPVYRIDSYDDLVLEEVPHP